VYYEPVYQFIHPLCGKKMFNMFQNTEKPISPTVYEGWQRDLLPLNLNFRNSIWWFVKKSITFIENLCHKTTTIVSSSLQFLAASVVVVVCPRAYLFPYKPIGYSPVRIPLESKPSF